ncbi:hypothetical protein G6F57_009587 [Rhizopus arrhizus]|uniref:Uncharacterized protein n=1 Tax=Rhizopus oryzae TaxID=64495 RepID=A0A9P6X2Z6_RHIOR|nr:hypothetical protein G6F23_009006 [Rhizopus arrhizus]KAG1411919.1 hypothetical protein G6F58_008297 [Rhizopus delemar]KAG0757862.1 hypothetical protein G6F24_010197 [Rhizopus arrhizus]KAG0784767.1 hypothetical protein G6F21_009698 [Rhizopus arrhizus]KAG0787671.1 hypothetical protein G6F22_007237 [Rhizopus arrhizus]
MSTKCEKLSSRIGKMVAESLNAGEINEEDATIAQCTFFAATMSMYEGETDKFVKPDIETFEVFTRDIRMFSPQNAE